MRVHTYVIATDVGSAPNYDAPFVTLAVCKPRIRRKANIGELVLAFAGKAVNPHEPHSVVWAGVVSEKLEFSEYWNDKRFATKKPTRCAYPDNFYRPTSGGGLLWVDNPVHGPDAARHDTNGQFVLVFEPSWHFGASGPLLPERFGLRMTHGRRGERIADATASEWQGLIDWLNGQSADVVDQSKSAPCRSRLSKPQESMPREKAGRCSAVAKDHKGI